MFLRCFIALCTRSESQRKTAAIVGLRDGQLTFSDPALAVSTSHPDRAFRYMLHLLGRKVGVLFDRQMTRAGVAPVCPEVYPAFPFL